MPERHVVKHHIDSPPLDPTTQRELVFIGIELNKARARPALREIVLGHLTHDQNNFPPNSLLHTEYAKAIAEVRSLMGLNS